MSILINKINILFQNKWLSLDFVCIKINKINQFILDLILNA